MNIKDKQILDKKEQIKRYYSRINNLEQQIYERYIFLLKKRFNVKEIMIGKYREDYKELYRDKKWVDFDGYEYKLVESIYTDEKIIIAWFKIDEFMNVREDFPRYFTIYTKENDRLKEFKEMFF